MKQKRECSGCGDTVPQKRWDFLGDKPVKLCVHCQQEAEDSGQFKRHMMSSVIRFKGDEVESHELVLERGTA